MPKQKPTIKPKPQPRAVSVKFNAEEAAALEKYLKGRSLYGHVKYHALKQAGYYL